MQWAILELHRQGLIISVMFSVERMSRKTGAVGGFWILALLLQLE